MFKRKKIYAALTIAFFSTTSFAGVPKINPPNLPLATSGPAGVLPNIMMVFDTSGSMAWDYLGDQVGAKPANGRASYANLNCKGDAVQHSSYSGGSPGVNYKLPCNVSGVPDPSNNFDNFYSGYEAPYMSSDYNMLAYNPNITYKPPVDSTGKSLGDRPITDALINPFKFPNQYHYNLTADLFEQYYCNVSNVTPTDTARLTNPSICRRNGVDNGQTFDYATDGYPTATFKYPVTVKFSTLNIKPFYYRMETLEYCDSSGVNCSASPSYGQPYKLRWCKDSATALSGTIPSGAGKCQGKYEPSKFAYPRYGKLTRVDVPESQYTNYANWWTYYRTRINSMKSATSLAFQTIGDDKRVGFITIYAADSKTFLPVGAFTQAQKDAFYKMLFDQNPGGGTPLREAMSRVGLYYAGKLNSGLTSGMNVDPVQYSCQKNFSILATDGYWNGNAGKAIDGSGFSSGAKSTDSATTGNTAIYAKRSDGVYDGGATTTSGGSLSDVTFYYYATPLRQSGFGNTKSGVTGSDLTTANVPVTAEDPNPNQHMVTFTMSLGLDGAMDYTKDYYKGNNLDLEKVKAGVVGCSWGAAGSVCNWPDPKGDSPTAIDDLWHAAINGRGRYFSAQDPKDMVDGLNEALNTIGKQTGAAAAAATSAPNLTGGDNAVYLSTYRTAKWDGDIVSKPINSVTGAIGGSDGKTINWSARDRLKIKVAPKADGTDGSSGRKIYYIDNSTSKSGQLVEFKYGSMSTKVKSYFDNMCTNAKLSQCNDTYSQPSPEDKSLMDSGDNLVNYLRGSSKFEISTNKTNPLFRDRDYVLGDIVNSTTVFAGQSRYNWEANGYSAYKTATASRTKMVYVGSNDGMIHAINAATGEEVWAVIPNQQLSKMYVLADSDYINKHTYFVDGQISVMDTYINGGWKTLLITGMGQGGNGYTILDVTNPEAPKSFAEVCNNNSCGVVDSALGLSYGNPMITQSTKGTPVAYFTSGYDNSNGSGVLYELSLETLALTKYNTPVASDANNQVGLAMINGYYPNFDKENKTDVLYAGDLTGTIWKFDFKNNQTIQLGKTKNDGTQPISTKIDIGTYQDKIILFVGTGRFLNSSDAVITQGTQSVYGIVDNSKPNGELYYNSGIVSQQLSVTKNKTTGMPEAKINGNKPVDYTKNLGWKLDLTAQQGERVNIDPALAVGTLNVISNVPGTSMCTSGGNSWYYQIDFTTGGGVSDKPVGQKLEGGLSVGQVIVRLGGAATGDQNMLNIITDANGTLNAKKMNANAKDDGGASRDVSLIGWREVFKTNLETGR